MAQLTRYYMYKKIWGYFNRPIRGKILGISGIDNFDSLISINSVVINTNYPEVDMQNLPYRENSFDFVISDQVIEHLENPKKAIDESHRVLKTGGIAVHTTCFMNAVHRYPKDYWRFTPEALNYLCHDFSDIIQCAGWGNRLVLMFCFISHRFRAIRIPENHWDPRYWIATWNEEFYPIVTWIIARK